MLSFKNRFHGYGSLRYVYKNGQIVRGRLITIKYSENPRRKTPRVAVVVSKKVHKRAVGRNRIRRRVYEVIRQELPNLAPNYDIVLLVFSSELLTLPHAELVSTIKQLLATAQIYKNQS
jgi:ribonuclease P protein component